MTHKLLLIENETLLMRALVRALARVPALEVLTAMSFEEARELLDHHADLCVVVADYYLSPQRTSHDLLSWCVTERPTCRKIIMSGRELAMLDVPAHLYDVFIAKPFSIHDFREVVIQQLDAHQERCLCSSERSPLILAH